MFERYTEKARRTIFFARYEASQYGSPYIETEHLLLGMLREDKALTRHFLRSHIPVESIRKQIEQHTIVREKVSVSVDLPLSNECKRVLAYAAEEAERLGHKYIGNEHLLLGLLREGNSFAAKLLGQHGLELAEVSKQVQEQGPSPTWGQSARFIAPLLNQLQRGVKVANLEASSAFYSKLGFYAIGGSTQEGVLILANGPCHIALYEARIAENLFCLRTGDMAAAAQQTQAAGLVFEIQPHRGEHGISALLRDPDGNAIYLVANPG